MFPSVAIGLHSYARSVICTDMHVGNTEYSTPSPLHKSIANRPHMVRVAAGFVRHDRMESMSFRWQ